MSEILKYITEPTCQIPNLSDLYMDFFGYRTEGFFVDVGAFDGKKYSNTYCLTVAGWTGVLIEPLPKNYEKCKELCGIFRNLTAMRYAVGSSPGTFMIYSGENHSVSSLSRDFVKKMEEAEFLNFTEATTCYIETLDRLLDALKLDLKFEEIDLISIDVEGMEMDVLRGFDIVYWKPKMVIVEAHENRKKDDRLVFYPEINSYFENHNYKKIYSDEINNIYTKKEQENVSSK